MLIFNSIQTAVFARRREIEVMKLVGATNWFIRVPFILEGFIQGLLGALIAWGAVLDLPERVAGVVHRQVVGRRCSTRSSGRRASSGSR